MKKFIFLIPNSGYYYGFRYYQPWVGRWLNPDPAGIIDGLNLYRMVRNNPFNNKDIHGLMPWSWKKKNNQTTNSNPEAKPSTSSGNTTASQKPLNIVIERLVDLIEEGRGGARALTGSRFESTMSKLSTFFIDLQPEGSLSEGKQILISTKEFNRPPKDLVNQTRESKDMYSFLKPYLERDINSETFCLQNLTSDLAKLTTNVLQKNQCINKKHC